MSVTSTPRETRNSLRSSFSSLPAWSLAMAIFSIYPAFSGGNPILNYPPFPRSRQDGRSLFEAPEDEHAVGAAEAEGVREGGLDLQLPRRVRDIVEVALGVRRGVVNGRGQHAVVEREGSKDSLYAASGTEEVPCHALGRAYGELFGVLSEDRLYGHGLVEVVIIGRRAVGVDVADVLGVEARALQGHLHAPGSALAVRRGRRHVVCVRVEAVAYYLGVYLRPALLRRFHLFQYENARALAYYEAVPVLVKGPARGLRVVVPGRERLHGVEAGHAQRGNRGLGASGHHDVGHVGLDEPQGFAYRTKA